MTTQIETSEKSPNESPPASVSIAGTIINFALIGWLAVIVAVVVLVANHVANASWTETYLLYQSFVGYSAEHAKAVADSHYWLHWLVGAGILFIAAIVFHVVIGFLWLFLPQRGGKK